LQNRTQFSVSFFIFGLLFLLFDLEILLVYPFSVSSYTNDIYGLGTMLMFFILLTLGFIFELGKGALNLDSEQTSTPINNNSVNLDLFITLQSSVFNILVTYLVRVMRNHYLSRLNEYLCIKITFYLELVFRFLFKRYPIMFRKIDNIFNYVYIFHLRFLSVMVTFHSLFKNRFPIIFYILLCLYKEYSFLLTGNINRNGFLLITLYVFYSFNSDNLYFYLLLITTPSVEMYIKNSK